MSLRNIKTIEYYVRLLLKKSNLLHLATGSDINPKTVVNMYREYVNIQDKQEWHVQIWDDSHNVTNGNKLRLYRQFKNDICTESYLTSTIPYQHRKYLAMFRSGCLPLEVELGRRDGTPLDKRFCKMCFQNVVEDEIHILLKCPLYDDVRSNLLSDIHDTGMSLQKQFIQILSCPEQQALLEL